MDYLEAHGHAFQQMHVPDKLVHLIAALHSMSWFQADGAESYGYTRAVGRQGCKLGGTVFSCCYALATIQLVNALRQAGIVTNLKFSPNAFWAPSSSPQCSSVDVLDVAFVDDLGIVLFARNRSVLMRSIDVLLQCIVETFDKHRMKINLPRVKPRACSSCVGTAS